MEPASRWALILLHLFPQQPQFLCKRRTTKVEFNKRHMPAPGSSLACFVSAAQPACSTKEGSPTDTKRAALLHQLRRGVSEVRRGQRPPHRTLSQHLRRLMGRTKALAAQAVMASWRTIRSYASRTCGRGGGGGWDLGECGVFLLQAQARWQHAGDTGGGQEKWTAPEGPCGLQCVQQATRAQAQHRPAPQHKPALTFRPTRVWNRPVPLVEPGKVEFFSICWVISPAGAGARPAGTVVGTSSGLPLPCTALQEGLPSTRAPSGALKDHDCARGSCGRGQEHTPGRAGQLRPGLPRHPP